MSIDTGEEWLSHVNGKELGGGPLQHSLCEPKLLEETIMLRESTYGHSSWQSR